MSFHSPHLLWLLVPLMLLFSWELARHTARAALPWPKISRAWAGAFQVSLGSAHTTAENRPRLWLWFGLALCIVAIARPQWGAVEEKVFDQSREVLIAIDLSRSMLTQDVKPSRLDRSKLLISSLLDGLKGERVGLVLFAGTSFLQSPLSADYEVLREFLPALKPEYLPEGGSNYKAMLEASIQSFGTSTADRYLIILSDGESTDENWKEMSETLKTKGIRVIGLGVGTPQGGFIPDGSGGFVKDERGAVVLSRLNSSTLQELAQLSGGAYADASAWIDLSALLKQTVDAGKKGDFSEKSTARLIERFQWFLAPGLLLLVISFWAEFPVRPRERALPLAASSTRKFPTPKAQGQTIAASLLVLFLLSTLSSQLSTLAAAAESPGDVLSAPLTTTVTRLVAQDALRPKDCADLAETTVTYGQRLKSAQQQPVEGIIHDALAAVDQGEQTDAKAADWPKLRRELEEFLKKNEPPKQDQKNQDQQKQDKKDKDQQQKKDERQKQDQQDKDSPDKKQKDQQEQQKSDQQKKDEQQKDSQNQPQEPKEDAFGDMKEKQPPAPKPEPAKQPPPSGTQKVGGQVEKKPDATLDPELAVPLQKLEQVRNQDSPALLQQLMQGKPQKPKPNSKDW